MRTEVLQPWITVQGLATSSAMTTVTTVIQEEECWHDVSGYSDATFWVDVRAVSSSTGTMTLTLESSPTKDETFFVPVATMPLLAASPTPFVVKSAPGAASANPIARWLRWRITNTSGTTGAWSATFRIRVAHSRTPYFTPMCVPGCKLWLRADLGVGLTGSALQTWADQSGNAGNTLTSNGQAGGTAYSTAQFNGSPGVSTGNGVNSLQASSGVVLAQPSTLIVVVQSLATPAALQDIVYGSGATPVSLAQTASTYLGVTVNAGAAQAVALSSSLGAPGGSILQVDWNTATQVYQNGTAQGGTVNAGANAMTFASVGANNTGASDLDGWVAEVLAFSPTLTSTWRTLVTRYLGARYYINVP